MNNFRNIPYNTLTKHHDADLISTGTYQESYFFRIYLCHFKKKCLYTHIMKTIEDTCAQIHTDELELIHAISKRATAIVILDSPGAISTINAHNITPINIDVYTFLQYVYVKLLGKSGILTFYDNLCAQSQRFNMCLRSIKEITKLLGTIHDGMDMDMDCVCQQWAQLFIQK